MTVYRKSYIDIAKGLGQLCVIWGHIMLVGISRDYVYAFHMPLFFFLSGLVYNKEKYTSFKGLFLKRMKTLFIPYCVFSVITWMVWAVYNVITHGTVESYWMPLFQTILSQGSGGYLVHNSTLWFVTCLLVVEFIYFFICKINKTFLRLAICIVIACIGLCIIRPESPLRYSVWSIDMAFCAIPFYAIGHIVAENGLIGKMIDSINKNKAISLIISGGVLQ